MGSEFSLVCRGATIRYRRFGQGPALLFLRSEDSLADAPAFIDALAKDFDVIVPDHPGFRASDTPDWLKGIGDAAYFYLDFLEQLDLDRVHLVGGSLGGWIAAEVAVRTCERIATLNLIAPLGVRRKGMPFGDIFMWTPEENLRHRLFDQALAEQFLADGANAIPRGGDGLSEGSLRDGSALLASALPQSGARTVAAPYRAAAAPDLGRFRQGRPGRHRRDLAAGAAAGAAERDRTMRSLAPARASAGNRR